MTTLPDTGGFDLFLSCSRLGITPAFEDSVDLASRHGFRLVEPPAHDQHPAGRGGDPERLVSTLERRGLRFGPALLPVDFRGEERGFEAGLAALDHLAEGWAAIGVPSVSTYVVPASESLTYRENFAAHTARLRRCADVLGGHGLRLGIEYVGPSTARTHARHPFVHTLQETLELIDAIAAPNVGVHLDSFHWYTAGESTADLERLDARQVIGVDVNDAVPGVARDEQGDHRRELPGASGVILLAEFVGALRRIGYGGPVAAEPFSASIRALPHDLAVAATAASLRAVTAR